MVQSSASGEAGPTGPRAADGPHNASGPRGGLTPSRKSGALSDHPTPDAAAWGHSPDEPVWRVVIAICDRGGRGPRSHWSDVSHKVASGEAGEGVRRGHRPKTCMAVFST